MNSPTSSNLLVDSIINSISTNDNNNIEQINSTTSITSSPELTPLLLDSNLTSSGQITPSLNTNEKTITTTIETIGAGSISTEISSNGIIHLRPIPPRGLSASKIKSTRIHSFTPRISHFDRDNPHSQKDPFRGFYTLFWIAISISAIRTGVANYTSQGTIWGGLSFATLMSEDAKMLALSDAIMVSVTFLAVPFVKLMERDWIRYEWTGCLIQHFAQTVFLALAVRWTFYREWPWVQSGFMTLHTLSTLMKVHSYCSYNGDLSTKNRRLSILRIKLKDLVLKLGGNDLLEKEARLNWEKEAKVEEVEEEEEEESEVNGMEKDGLGGVSTMKEFSSKDESGREPRDSSRLRNRRRSTSRRHSIPSSSPPVTNLNQNLVESSSSSSSPSTPPPQEAEEIQAFPSAGIDLLTWHPNSIISEVAVEIADLRDALTSTGKDKIQFPENVTMWNFLDYLLVPTLVYQLEYPRTERIRPMYILEKGAATLGTLMLLILIVEHYILPISPAAHENSFLISALDLAIPFMVNYLLIFYIIFECICNLFAEITLFADREFYSDWWNSTSFDEFARKWNRPVHFFLLRHVYSSTRTTYKFSKFQAAFVTFLLSALVHELVMAVVTQKIRLFLFSMQMLQLPMIYIGSLPVFKKYPAAGNVIFWLGLLSGFPLLAVAYIRY